MKIAGKNCARDITEGFATIVSFGFNVCRKTGVFTSQGSRGHQAMWKVAIMKRLEENTMLGPTATVLTNLPASTCVLDVSDNHHSVMVLPSTSSISAIVDNRKGNRGSYFRLRRTAIQKDYVIICFEDRNSKMTVAMLIKEHRLGKRFEKCIRTVKLG